MFDPIIHFLLMTSIRVKEAAKKPRDDSGAAAVEYGLLVALIAGVIIVAVLALGNKLTGMFTTVTNQL